MLKRALVVAVVLIGSGLAAAQNPRFTIFAGYSYGNTNYAPASAPPARLGSFDRRFRLRPWLTVVADGSANTGWNQFPISCVTVPVCTPAIPDCAPKNTHSWAAPRSPPSAETSVPSSTCWAARRASRSAPRASLTAAPTGTSPAAAAWTTNGAVHSLPRTS